MPSIYQPRRPRASPLWQLVHHGLDDFLADYEKHHRKSLGPLRPAAIATVQSFLRCGDLAAGFSPQIRPHAYLRGLPAKENFWQIRLLNSDVVTFFVSAEELAPIRFRIDIRVTIRCSGKTLHPVGASLFKPHSIAWVSGGVSAIPTRMVAMFLPSFRSFLADNFIVEFLYDVGALGEEK